jgi:hypothetical protein
VPLARRTVEAIDAELSTARSHAAAEGLLLTELELVEPSFFFRHSRRAADRLAAAIARRLSDR